MQEEKGFAEGYPDGLFKEAIHMAIHEMTLDVSRPFDPGKETVEEDKSFDLFTDEILIPGTENPEFSSPAFSPGNTEISHYNFDGKNLGNINPDRQERYDFITRTSLFAIDCCNNEENSSSPANNPEEIKEETPDTGENTDSVSPDNNPEEAKEESANTGENPAAPKTRFEFRFKYQNLSNDKDVFALTLRYDKVFKQENNWRYALRLDFPLLMNNISSGSTEPPENYKFGSSDLVTQFLFIPPMNGSFDIAFGVQHIFPLGSDDQFGRGKYIIAPVFTGVYVPESLPRGSFTGFLLRNEFSYAGNDERRDVNELVINPFFNVMLPGKWFIFMSSGMRVNWARDNNFFLPIELTLGKIVGTGKSISLKGGVGLIKDYNFYDYELELTTAIYF